MTDRKKRDVGDLEAKNDGLKLAVVFGTGRSGTTLVQEVLTRHASTGFVSNIEDKFPLLHYDGRWNQRIYQHVPPKDPALRPFKDRRKLWESGRVRLAPSEAWEVMDRQVSSIWAKPCRDLVASDATPWLKDRFRNFFQRRADAQGSSVFVAHWTGWPRAGFAEEAIPGTRFIHVIRDGRAVANSWLQMGWWDGYHGPSRWYLGQLSEQDQRQWEEDGRSFVTLAGLGWRMLIENFEKARALLPGDQWLDVRYEDVLQNPEQEYRRMLDFLGLDWSRRFEQGFRRYRFETGRKEAFRRDLDPANLARLERILEPTLERYGYETGTGQK
ncbi:MAG: sulfotransferase [Proteobacteria bacterium]|nr:sulfotransferase [Pseudomonadota bacterium]